MATRRASTTRSKAARTDWSTHGFVRVAAASPAVHVGRPDRNVAEHVVWAERAANDNVALLVFPELSLTGYTCEDLFLTDGLQRMADSALVEFAAATSKLPVVFVVGAPMRSAAGRRYNTAVVIHRGDIVGAVPKQHLPNCAEFYERRWFTPGFGANERIRIGSLDVSLRPDSVFEFGPLRLGIEICEDLWAPEPPSGALALAGANVIVNPSASNELIAKATYRKALINSQSARFHVAYVYAGAGATESTKDVVFGGHTLVSENGSLLAEGERFELDGSWCTADVDIDRLANERARNITWSTAPQPERQPISVPVSYSPTPIPKLRRSIARNPFVPDDPATRDERAREILAIQSTGLARRLRASAAQRCVIGVSGGLDSTLALIVAVEAVQRLGRSPSTILGITMPGFGTTSRTRSAADDLMAGLGVEAHTVPITKAVKQHFADIGHDPDDHSVTYENAQARERTQILFDVANKVGGIVIGTGDLSELALGWCTFNADHMANYGVNAGVPKTLVRHLVRWWADTVADPSTATVLRSILDTPVSPELLPPDAKGNIVQATEDMIGPYELHDFFLWHLLRNGSSLDKIRALSAIAFEGFYDAATIDRWLGVFVQRFFRQQFKRTTLPPAPKVGSVSVSPRGDLRLPDEIDPSGMT